MWPSRQMKFWTRQGLSCLHMCDSLSMHICVFMTPSVPVCEVLLECCVHCSKVCFSVFCSSSRNLCVFLPSGTGGGKATAAAGVTAGQQQQQRSEGRKAAARSSSSRRGKAPGVHRTAHIGAFQWRSQAAKLQQFVLQPAAAFFEPTGFLKSAVCLACFSRHPCCPTAPDLSYFLGRFYHLVVTACLFV